MRAGGRQGQGVGSRDGGEGKVRQNPRLIQVDPSSWLMLMAHGSDSGLYKVADQSTGQS